MHRGNDHRAANVAFHPISAVAPRVYSLGAMIATSSQLGSASAHSGQPDSASPVAAVADRVGISRQEAMYDSELVRRFNAGDETAFVEIISRYREKMLSIALCHLRNHADAEEIAQDTFIRAHRGLARFRGDSSLATWLHRIAFNLSRNRYKYYRCRRRHVTLSLDCSLGDDNQSTFSDLIASEAPSPSREATSTEFTELVAVCMEKLGVRQRKILMLRNGLNRSYSDIAAMLGISTGTVKSRIGRARKNLRELMAQSRPDLAPNASPFDWFDPIRSGSRLELACA
jgi:RNA polymerase sigma-70 factor, ECF subfamily